MEMESNGKRKEKIKSSNKSKNALRNLAKKHFYVECFYRFSIDDNGTDVQVERKSSVKLAHNTNIKFSLKLNKTKTISLFLSLLLIFYRCIFVLLSPFFF